MKQKNIRLMLLRAVLILLIVLNMTVIFVLSSENGEQSAQTEQKVTDTVLETVIKDYETLSPDEQTQIKNQLHIPLRKLAHMAEFGTLGGLIFLLLLTWQGRVWLQYVAALAATALYAGSDEWHQSFLNGRTASALDILIDLAGALTVCTVILLVRVLIHYFSRKEAPKLKLTNYFLKTEKATPKLRIAVAADLHGNDHTACLRLLHDASPDLILIPGDLMEDGELENESASGYTFLRECAAIAPTYYSLGNHEIACYHKGNPWRHPTPILPSAEVRKRIAHTGAVLLDNESVMHGELCICGLTSGINRDKNEPNTEALTRFASLPGFRILLCHHPEYFMPYIRKTDIELTVSGHAHGGHWRVFGRGVYAPGQGLFPKYTAGVWENRLVISRGLGNHTRIPRICNTPELVMVYLGYRPEEMNLSNNKRK
ncbi:MAG: VanZ family protein [Clostridia bacterium]|nr:VanZ family protein [Clostridia bacterium]